MVGSDLTRRSVLTAAGTVGFVALRGRPRSGFVLREGDDGRITIERTVGDRAASLAAPSVVGQVGGSITFDDQTAEDGGTTVVVAEATLGIGGFVAIYEDDLTGPIIGVSEYLPRGTRHSDVEIELDEAITEASRLVAMAHADTNQNERFDFDDDSALDVRYEEFGVRASDEATVRPPLGSGVDLAVAGAGGALGVWVLARARARSRGRDQNGDDDGNGNRSPTAQIVYAPEEPEPGRPVLFDGALSFDPAPDDRVVRYDWTIGDTTSSGERVLHVFGRAGEVDVELVVTDTRGATGARTETVTVESTGGALEVERIHPGAPGTDPANLHHEYVTFTNAGDAAVELAGWSVGDAVEGDPRPTRGDHTYELPEGVSLDPGETLTVHTGSLGADEPADASTDRHLYWGERRPVWNDRSGIVVVTDEPGRPVVATRYERTEAGGYEIERLDPGSLGDWFPPVPIGGREDVPLPEGTVDRRIGRGAVSNAVGFVAGALFLRGPRKFVDSWALITVFLLVSLATWLLSTTVGPLVASVPWTVPVLLLVVALSATVVGGILVLLQRAIGFVVDAVT